MSVVFVGILVVGSVSLLGASGNSQDRGEKHEALGEHSGSRLDQKSRMKLSRLLITIAEKSAFDWILGFYIEEHTPVV